MSNKTGTSMSSIVITKKAIDRKRIELKEVISKKERAEVCIGCKCNDKGYCTEYSSWCWQVNHKCLQIKDSNQHRKKRKNHANNHKFSKKNNKEFNKLMDKYKEDPEAMIKKLKKKYKIK